MEKQITYFRRTTAQQRKLLFSRWQQTGNVALACREARVSRQTFYNWKTRFETDGNLGLEEPQSHAPHNPRRIPDEISKQVIAMRRQHPKWGKRRMASELKKANDWVPFVSPNTVRRILIDAGLWKLLVGEKKNSNRPCEPQRSPAKRQRLISALSH